MNRSRGKLASVAENVWWCSPGKIDWESCSLEQPFPAVWLSSVCCVAGFVYICVLSFWAFVLVVDFLLEFRLELLWPLWLLLTSVYDSFKYQGLVSNLNQVHTCANVTVLMLAIFVSGFPLSQYFLCVCHWQQTFSVSSSYLFSGCSLSSPPMYGYSMSGTQVKHL